MSLHMHILFQGNNLQSNGGENLDGQLMTSVSTPVFDRRNYSVRMDNYSHNSCYDYKTFQSAAEIVTVI